MKSRIGFALLLLFPWSSLDLCFPARISEVSNSPVVLISIDTCRADHLSCYGYSRKTTPNIDTVAEQAVVFDNAFSPVPLTLPSHSSLLTGTTPRYHGVHNNDDYRLGKAFTTLAELLREQGYRTAAFVGAFVLDSQFGLDQGFETYNDSFEQTRKFSDFAFAERRAGEVSYHAITWLMKHSQEPFFLFLHYFDPHIDYAPPEPFASRYSDQPYAGEIAYTDYCIGLVLDQLKSLGVYESALLIITSDHGEGLGQHGETSHGYFVYQSTLRVPLIVKPPGGCEAKQIDDPVGLIDLVPTVTGVLRIPVPAEVQGEDLSDYFAPTPPSLPHRAYYFESLSPTRFGCNPLFGATSGDWKLIRSARPELYNLRRDSRESHNLLDQERAQRHRLEVLLDGMLQQNSSLPESETRVVLDADSRRKLESLGYMTGGATRRGSSDWQRATGCDPKDFIELADDMPKAFSLFSQGYHETARQFCEKILAKYPEVIDAHHLRGEIALAQEDLDRAVHHFSEYLRLVYLTTPPGGSSENWMWLQPNLHVIHNNLGLCLFKQGKVEEAVRHYRQALDVNPEYVEAHTNLGNVRLTQGKWQEAIGHFRRAVDIQPNFAPAHNNLGFALASTGDPEQAIQHYRRAVDIQPEYADAHFNLGNELAKQEKLEEAVAELTEAVRLEPERANAHNNLGHALARLGRLDEATRAYTKTLQLDPNHVMANINLGIAYCALKKLDEAIQHLNRALEIQPGHPEALRQLGITLARQGKLEEAVSAFAQAVEAMPGSPLMRFNLAFAQAKLGQLEQAALSYASALEIQPDYLKAHYNLGKVFKELGRTEQATHHFRRALQIDPTVVEAADALAWILATARDENVRDGTEAVRFALQACEGTGYKNPGYLDTLAAAYAEAGQFQQAVETADKAMAWAQNAGRQDLVKGIIERKRGYEKREPYREPVPNGNGELSQR